MPCHNKITRRQAGFSLLEVLVALLILSVSLSAVSGVFSKGLQLAAAGDMSRQALLYAAGRMESLKLAQSLQAGQTQGNFDGRYQWQLTITEEPGMDPGAYFGLYDIDLLVRWQERGRQRQHRLYSKRIAAKTGT